LTSEREEGGTRIRVAEKEEEEEEEEEEEKKKRASERAGLDAVRAQVGCEDEERHGVEPRDQRREDLLPEQEDFVRDADGEVDAHHPSTIKWCSCTYL